MAGTLFASVQIIGGSGAEPFKGHVLVEGDRIQTARRCELTSDMARDCLSAGGSPAKTPANSASDRPRPAPTWRLGVRGDGSDDCGSSAVPSAQRVEQRLGLLQIGRIEALREPAIDRSKEIAGVVVFALVAPEPAKAAGGPEFP
jgi:hypothetical protein